MREELREALEKALEQLPEQLLPVEVAHIVVAFVSSYSEDVNEINKFLALASAIAQKFTDDMNEMERSTKH